MSDVIMDRVDEMSSRLDGLEKSVQELMVQVRNGFTDGMKCLHWDAIPKYWLSTSGASEELLYRAHFNSCEKMALGPINLHLV